MAYIESHQNLERHPKLADLMARMGWDKLSTIGALHCFWYWCVDYAESGDLRKYSDATLGDVVALNGSSAKLFVESMVAAGWLDRDPYFRVHDWWDYIGPWLRSKYKRSPDKWKAIRALYRPDETDEEHKDEQPLRNRYVTANQTKPNQPTNKSGAEKLVEELRAAK